MDAYIRFPGAAGARSLKLRIDSFSSVEVAVQHVAQGFTVALLLADQFPLFGDPPETPPRVMSGGAVAEARALLKVACDLHPDEFLDSAASIFGVAEWPSSVRPGFVSRS